MKLCPQCGSTYSDDTLNYCLTDRSVLVAFSEADAGEPTVIRDYPSAPPTQTLHTEGGVSPVFKYLAIALGIFLLLLAGAGFAAWSFWNSPSAQPEQTTAATPSPGGTDAPGRSTANTNGNKEPGRNADPMPSRTPTPQPSPTQPPKEIPKKDAGTSRITFKKGSVSQTVGGSIVNQRSFVLRTMAGQFLTARVNSSRGCVEFEDGGKAVEFDTPSGDVSLKLTNTCDEPVTFSMSVTVR